MSIKEELKHLASFVEPYKFTSGKHFKLSDVDPADTHKLTSADKDEAKLLLSEGISHLAALQDVLSADDRYALLVIFQAMDAAGKDSTIKHVMSGINPQGCQVYSFKQPSAEELDHDFMWRYMRCLPERGRIGIFNRSYYEEVLVVRVHKEILKQQKLHPDLVTKHIWEERLEDIANIEQYLVRNGVIVVKFFLHLSRKEQKRRFMERLDKPDKNWKFAPSDVQDRQQWREYMEAYEDAIRATATKDTPWYVVPADNKWFTRLVVAGAIVHTLEKLDIEYPKLDAEQLSKLRTARALLEKE